MLKQLDLCSGVGAGFPLAGLQLRGFQLAGLCECNEFCRDRLRDRFPGVPIYPDVRSLQLRKGEFDVVTASPACQPFSVEGQRRGKEDERDCFPHLVRAIAATKPKFFAFENVPGLLSCPYRKGGSSGGYFRQLLASIHKSGYDAEWLCVSSGHFAAPWKRERLLLVGISRSLELHWERATPWTEQARSQLEAEKLSQEQSGVQPGLAGVQLRLTSRLDISIGVKSGNSISRARREALGNALDPRVAAIALRRILYLSQL